MVNPNRFYTYAYLREDRTPYYIGKGSYKRIYNKKGKPCGIPKDKSRIIFLKQNLTEEEAFKHEIYMIAVFGRKDLETGILHNRTDGGEGCSGMICREDTKLKIKNSNLGKKHTEKSKKKMSELARLRTHTEETKRKIGEASKNRKPLLGRKMSKELKEKLRQINLGKKHSEKSKKKMSDAHKGRIYKSLTDEHKRKLSKSNKRKHVITDEIRNKISNSLCKKTYKLISPSGKEIILKNITKFCKDNNLSLSGLRRTIYGKTNNYKGWTGQVLSDVV
jgi:hypothetical protein